MQITCSECKKAINIPDDKVPKDKAFALGCPFCKAKIKVDQHLQQSPSAPADSPGLNPASMVVSDDFGDDEEDEKVKFVQEGTRLALVLDNRHREAWAKILTELGFFVDKAKSPEHAVHKMKFTQYDVLILDEAFAPSLTDNAVYQNLQEMPMVTRRRMFVSLVGGSFHSMSNMEAYQHSANMVVNEKDLDKLAMIFKKSLSDHDNFYKVYKDTMHQLGKL